MTDSEAAANRFGLLPSDFDYDAEASAIAERFLGDLGCGVDEAHALATNGGTPEMMKAWEKARRFRRALAKCREMGETERRDAVAKAERRSDPFATPPRPGMTDVAAEAYDVTTPKPPGALSRFLRKLGIEVEWQHAQRDEPRPAGQRFIPVSELTPADAQAIGRQNAQELARAQAQQQAERGDDPGAWQGQSWSKGEHIAPDGSGWVGAPAQHGGGLFSHTPNPDSVPG